MSRVVNRVATTLLAAIAVLAGTSVALAQPRTAAFVVDGEAYPRFLFDRKVAQHLEATGRDIGSIRHPAVLRRYQGEVLERLIDEQLIAAAARRDGMRVDERAIEDYLRRAPSPAGVPAEIARAEAERDLLVEGWLQRESATVRVDDAAVDAAMARETRPSMPERVRLRQIVFPATASVDQTLESALDAARREAADVLARVRDGADFEPFARALAVGTTGPDDGDLGWLPRGRLAPAMEAAAFAAREGEVLGPLRSPLGMVLVRVEGREDPRPMTDDEWRRRTQTRLGAEAFTAHVQKTVAALRDRATIRVLVGLRRTPAGQE